jgi:hypothetical protein
MRLTTKALSVRRQGNVGGGSCSMRISVQVAASGASTAAKPKAVLTLKLFVSKVRRNPVQAPGTPPSAPLQLLHPLSTAF